MNDRDTHFQESAKLLYDKIGTLNTRDIQRFGDYTSFDVAAKKLIAQYAYDLVYHALYCANINQRWWPGSPEYGNVSDLYHREIREQAFDIPDLTEWPPD